jgi:glutamate-1-semialdehyde 2,1-aminomutase
MSILVEYVRLNPKSKTTFERACRYLPSGCTRNVLFYPPFPLYMSAGRGSRLWDVDGNERIDFNFNNTTLILGHNHPAVIEAVEDQLGRGTVLGAPTEVEVELSEELVQRLRGADNVRFTPSGTEANLQAIRLARSYTGKDKIAKCEGAYHGSWDAVDISVAPPPDLAGPEEAPKSVRQYEGIPEGVIENTLVFPYNDAETVEKFVKSHRHELAAVIVEPTQRDMAPDQRFLEVVREVTERYGVLLIFDEVISFRVSPGGAQERYGIMPDITTMGKIIGGGFPVGAYASTEEIMRSLIIPETPFPHLKPARLGFSGTFNAHPITMAAGLAVMKEMRPTTYENLDKLGRQIRTGLKSTLDNACLTAHVGGVGSLFHIAWTKEEVVNYRTAATGNRIISRYFSTDLMNRGIFLSEHPNISVATSNEDVKEFLKAMKQSISNLKPIINEWAPHLIAEPNG